MTLGLFVGLVAGVVLGWFLAQRDLTNTVQAAFEPVISAAMGVRHMHDDLNEALLALEAHPLVDLHLRDEDS